MSYEVDDMRYINSSIPRAALSTLAADGHIGLSVFMKGSWSRILTLVLGPMIQYKLTCEGIGTNKWPTIIAAYRWGSTIPSCTG